MVQMCWNPEARKKNIELLLAVQCNYWVSYSKVCGFQGKGLVTFLFFSFFSAFGTTKFLNLMFHPTPLFFFLVIEPQISTQFPMILWNDRFQSSHIASASFLCSKWNANEPTMKEKMEGIVKSHSRSKLLFTAVETSDLEILVCCSASWLYWAFPCWCQDFIYTQQKQSWGI